MPNLQWACSPRDKRKWTKWISYIIIDMTLMKSINRIRVDMSTFASALHKAYNADIGELIVRLSPIMIRNRSIDARRPSPMSHCGKRNLHDVDLFARLGFVPRFTVQNFSRFFAKCDTLGTRTALSVKDR